MKEKFLKRLADVLGVTYKNMSDAYHLVEKEFDAQEDAEELSHKSAEEIEEINDLDIGSEDQSIAGLSLADVAPAGVTQKDIDKAFDGEDVTDKQLDNTEEFHSHGNEAN